MLGCYVKFHTHSLKRVKVFAADKKVFAFEVVTKLCYTGTDLSFRLSWGNISQCYCTPFVFQYVSFVQFQSEFEKRQSSQDISLLELWLFLPFPTDCYFCRKQNSFSETANEAACFLG